MGIRFRCHFCNQPLNVKDHLAGRRGKCPGCSGSFRIPAHDADLSIPLDEPVLSNANAASSQSTSSSKTSSGKRKSAETELTRPETAKPESAKLEAVAGTPNGSAVDLPASLIAWVDARWFVRPPSGGQYGPATTRMLADWIVERRVTPETFLWREGMESWQVATLVVPEAFGSPVLASGMMPPPAEVYVAPTSPDIAREASKGSMAAAKAALTLKRKRQRMRSWIILGLLVTIAIALVATLFVVLWR